LLSVSLLLRKRRTAHFLFVLLSGGIFAGRANFRSATEVEHRRGKTARYLQVCAQPGVLRLIFRTRACLRFDCG
jgi:hypothetical protein